MWSESIISIKAPSRKRSASSFNVRVRMNLRAESSEYDPVNNVFIVANLNGHFTALYRLLVNNGIMNSSYKWLFGTGHLVVLGNCLGLEPPSTECLWLLFSLEERARREGGHVHFILGKREIFHLNDSWRFDHPQYAYYGKSNRPLNALFEGNNLLWRWLQTKNIMEKIGSMLFVSGGISPLLINSPLSITEINHMARTFYKHIPYLTPGTFQHSLLTTDDSPLLYSGLNNQSLVEAALDKFEASLLITGNENDRATGDRSKEKTINVNPIMQLKTL